MKSIGINNSVGGTSPKMIIHSSITSELEFINKSKCKALQHEWLYHCTSAEVLLNILKTREFWLTNLLYVNDKNEAERIAGTGFESAFFVSSFTYDSNITLDHWKEYGTIDNGVIIAVKPSWFVKKAYVTVHGKHLDDEFWKIYEDHDEALKAKDITQQIEKRIINPFYIGGFGFYEVVYDDDLVKEIFSDCTIEGENGYLSGKSVIPEVAGIVKNRNGECQREGKPTYEKNWESEKEVRLKLRVHQLIHNKNGNEDHDGMILPCPIQNLAVPLSKQAFQELNIGFSPEFKDIKDYTAKLKSLYPEMKISMLH